MRHFKGLLDCTYVHVPGTIPQSTFFQNVPAGGLVGLAMQVHLAQARGILSRGGAQVTASHAYQKLEARANFQSA